MTSLAHRGKRNRKHSTGAIIPDHTFSVSAKVTTATGMVPVIEDWVASELDPTHTGGASAKVPVATILIASLACAVAGLPATYVQLHAVITDPDMTPAARKHLGLPVSSDPEADAKLNEERMYIGYHAVARRYTAIAKSMDPKVYPSYRGLSDAKIREIDNERDPEVVAMKQARMDLFNATMLITTWLLLPEHVRNAWRGDVTVDATVVPIFGRFGPNSNKRKLKSCNSPEVNAYWHAKDPDRRDSIDGDTAHKDRTQYTFGYDAHLLLTSGPGVGDTFPQMVLGLSIDQPGRQPGLNAVAMLQGLYAHDLPKGLVTVDLGYSQLDPENFALPLRALGYGLNIMYKKNELGLQAHYEGALLVDGTWHGACLDQQLIDLSPNYEAGLITEDQYRAQLEQRRKYELKFLEVSSNGEGVNYACPAQGTGCAMNCPLPNRAKATRTTKKPGGRGRPAKKRQNVRKDQIPEIRQALCTNKTKTTIPISVGVRYFQEIPFESPEWNETYGPRRNQMEGYNRVLKDSTAAAIAAVDHRRYRGLGKQNLSLVFKALGANIQAILALLRDLADREEDTPNPGGRPATTTLADHRREPFGLPIRIAGRPTKGAQGKPEKPAPPGKPARAA